MVSHISKLNIILSNETLSLLEFSFIPNTFCCSSPYDENFKCLHDVSVLCHPVTTGSKTWFRIDSEWLPQKVFVRDEKLARLFLNITLLIKGNWILHGSDKYQTLIYISLARDYDLLYYAPRRYGSETYIFMRYGLINDLYK